MDIRDRIIDSVYYISLKYGNIPTDEIKEFLSILMKDTDNFAPGSMDIDNIVESVINKDLSNFSKNIRRVLINCTNSISDYFYYDLEISYEVPETFLSDWKYNSNKITKEFIDFYLSDEELVKISDDEDSGELVALLSKVSPNIL